MFRNILAGSRYLIIIAVGLVLLALGYLLGLGSRHLNSERSARPKDE